MYRENDGALRQQLPGSGEESGDGFTVALAGNPNTGKSTVFNALTGLRQHTGNWPGKTVSLAQGRFEYKENRFNLIDLPGTYSLLAASPDEEVARDCIQSGQPDVTVVVVDASRLERNLNLVLQILETTDHVVVCLNLVDEARRERLKIDDRALSRELGVPVVQTAARYNKGMDSLIHAIADMATGKTKTRPFRLDYQVPESKETGYEPLMETLYAHAAGIAERVVRRTKEEKRVNFTRAIDRVVTHKVWGFPLMLLLFSLVFWITIEGANIPSGWLYHLFLNIIYPFLKDVALVFGAPWWLSGVLIDGIYLACAWVVSVMLPPMAIFFPLFTLLEDFGYLPRVAFNLDRVFKKAGAHGKQSLTMMMGFGCNAAGVIAARIIDSPRERLIAIITNNFALCNGRWPTQILIATLFIGPLVPAYLAGVITAAAVVAVALLGVVLTMVVSWALSRTVLKGESSSFNLELPPYRPPRILKTLYTSFIDRTIFVLWRAVVFALPAGAIIWLVSNIKIGGISLAGHMISLLDPAGLFIGLNGVILLAYIVAIPANEIVIPTILMLTVMVTGMQDAGQGAGVIFEAGSLAQTLAILKADGWTLLTAVNLMLFSLLHNPCSTTLYTIKKETGSMKWTLAAAFIPLALGITIILLVAGIWRWLA